MAIDVQALRIVSLERTRVLLSVNAEIGLIDDLINSEEVLEMVAQMTELLYLDPDVQERDVNVARAYAIMCLSETATYTISRQLSSATPPDKTGLQLIKGFFRFILDGLLER